MKKRLLITMGCSMTQGVGCYDENDLKSDLPWTELMSKIYIKSLPHFHEFGWPNKLGNLLNYDKVINLGLGGSAPLTNLKHFFERYLDKDLSDYEVLILWMIPDSSRTSYYFEGRLESRMPFSPFADSFDKEFTKKMLNGDPLFNSSLDVIFAIKVMEQICENKGYSLLLSSTNDTCEEMYRKIYSSKHYLSKERIHPFSVLNNEDDLAPCGHPNKKGYEKVAKFIYSIIENEHPHLINKNHVENFEWEWQGNITHHRIENDEYQKYGYDLNNDFILYS